MKRTSIRSITAVLIFSALFATAIPSAAQKRRNTSASPTAATANKAPRCDGGWRGAVTLTKTLKDSHESDERGIRKEIDRIKHRSSRNYEYRGRMVVENADTIRPVTSTTVDFSDVAMSWGEERVFDTCNSREKGHWFIIEGTDDRFTEAKAEGPGRSFNLTVDEANGTYMFNGKFPDAAGQYRRDQDVKRSGHCQAKNNEPYQKNDKEPFKIAGEGFSVYGEKLDPNDPTRLTGTKIWGDDGKGAVRSFVYKLSWTFTKCPEDILVTDLRFEDMKFPTWNDWQEIVEQTGTIDGNLVRLKANVLNLSSETKFVEVNFKETYKGDKWDGARPDLPLHESVSVRLDAGELREVEVLWNSQGYAWFDDGRPRLVQRIKAEAWESFKLRDSKTKNLKVSPKPLVFVPGIWTDPKMMDPIFQNLLTISHSYGWKIFLGSETPASGTITAEGRPPVPTNGASVYDKADTLTKYVENVRRSTNAWHIDMLAHSTGGLVARLFVHKQMEVLPDNYPVVKHLMLLGTPNLGVPCADSMKLNDAFKGSSRTADELMPEEMARFNRFVTERKGTRFSALVGDSMPLLCATPVWNDGFVSVESAKHGISDFAITKSVHPDLIDQKHFGSFIKPHVVTGPRGTYPLPVTSEPGGVDRRMSGN